MRWQVHKSSGRWGDQYEWRHTVRCTLTDTIPRNHVGVECKVGQSSPPVLSHVLYVWPLPPEASKKKINNNKLWMQRWRILCQRLGVSCNWLHGSRQQDHRDTHTTTTTRIFVLVTLTNLSDRTAKCFSRTSWGDHPTPLPFNSFPFPVPPNTRKRRAYCPTSASLRLAVVVAVGRGAQPVSHAAGSHEVTATYSGILSSIDSAVCLVSRSSLVKQTLFSQCQAFSMSASACVSTSVCL